jgi:hypothetical protein
MKQSADAEKRLILVHKDQEIATATRTAFDINLYRGQKLDEKKDAIARFIDHRNAHIKYIRSSTEDLRNHVTTSKVGWVDCYQKFLILGEQTRIAVEKIETIKRDKNFPGN